MRLLYVTAGFPYPLTSGRLRHYYLIRELAVRHEVHLLSMVGPDTTDEHVAALERFATVHVERAARSVRRRVMTPLGIAVGPARSLGERAATVVSRGEVDAVLLAGTDTFPLFGLLRKRLPVVSDLCDLRSLNHLRRLRVASPRERPLLGLQYLLSRRRERVVLTAADAVLFASRVDRRAASSRVSADASRAAVVPNGVDIDYWRRRTDRLGRDVVFTGAMDYGPNVDAAWQLIDEIMPLVWREVPDARLRLVGRDPSDDLRQRADSPAVTITGFVDDVRPHLEEAAVFAAPLRFGAGIQNKVLEALAMEVPCVVSPLAAAGLAGAGRAPLDIAASSAEFAQSITDRLRAASVDASPLRDARSYVAARFSWASAARELEAVLAQVVNRHD